MDERSFVIDHRSSIRTRGVALAELVISTTMSLVLVLAVALLLDGGNRAWLRTYESAHGSRNRDARALMAAFGNLGRKSNRGSYVLYHIDHGTLVPALPDPRHPDSVVFADAVEFRYWDVPLDLSDSHTLMKADKKATAYALFYLDGSHLKVDYGPYPPGAAPPGGGNRNTTGVTTVVLASHVSVDPDSAPFSHNTVGGIGQGSVRLNVVLTDPENQQTTRVMTATLMRNIWPR